RSGADALHPLALGGIREGRRPPAACRHPRRGAIPPRGRGSGRRAGRAPPLQPLEPVRGRGRAVRRPDPPGPLFVTRVLRPNPARTLRSRARRGPPALTL